MRAAMGAGSSGGSGSSARSGAGGGAGARGTGASTTQNGHATKCTTFVQPWCLPLQSLTSAVRVHVCCLSTVQGVNCSRQQQQQQGGQSHSCYTGAPAMCARAGDKCGVTLTVVLPHLCDRSTLHTALMHSLHTFAARRHPKRALQPTQTCM